MAHQKKESAMSEMDAEACPLPRMQGPRVLAPELHAKFRDFFEALQHNGKLEPRIKEMARLRIAQLNACHH
jgi:alkylhydroperoxidase family enzyme